MKISDVIAKTIITMLEKSENGTAVINRNEFAGKAGCSPSQINYVLSSRFTPEHGYIIESQRGGGGYIKITRIKMNTSSSVMHIVNSIGEKIDSTSARIVTENCKRSGIISEEAAFMMNAAVSNGVMSRVPDSLKDTIRAAIIKQMLLTQI